MPASERDARAALDQAAQAGTSPVPGPDRDRPDGRHVHAETGARGGHERDLHRDGDQREAAVGSSRPSSELHPEGGEHARRQPDDVGPRAREQRALVAHSRGYSR